MMPLRFADVLLQLIQSAPRPPAIREIEQRLQEHDASLSASRPTILRLLASLAAKGKILRIGNTRNARYQAHHGTAVSEYALHFSTESRKLLAVVSQPFQQRRPIGYNQDWMHKYAPNHDFFLSSSLRQHLWQTGRTNREKDEAGTYARDILNRFLIDLSWASSNLEGNTYSLFDTQRLIEEGTVAGGKAALETQMIINHKQAIEMMIENTADLQFNSYIIQKGYSKSIIFMRLTLFGCLTSSGLSYNWALYALATPCSGCVIATSTYRVPLRLGPVKRRTEQHYLHVILFKRCPTQKCRPSSACLFFRRVLRDCSRFCGRVLDSVAVNQVRLCMSSSNNHD